MSRLPSVRPLPARVVPQPGESLASLLQRGAELMGYENAKRMQWLLKGSGPWSGNPNHFSHESLLARVGQLLLCSPQRLFQMTLHRYAVALVLVPPDAPPPTRCDGNTIVRYFFPAARPVCIRCLAEDPAPYERLAWRFRPLLACLRHRCALVMRCPVCRRSLRRGNETFADLGGLDALKTFCTRALRNQSNPDPAKRPRGDLLLSPPGCGKSQFCKALGTETVRPTLCMDIGSLMGSLVGSTEANIRQALRIADAMAPSVLFIDEIEKGLSGVASSGQTDSGVSARLFGYFLAWLNDHQSDVFVVATSNDISRLPPEFARAERFDGVFFLDFPGVVQRRTIWRMYIEKFGLDSSQPRPVDADWSGAEIRACCRLAALLDVPLVEAAQNIVPVARTAHEAIARLRQWASGRCLNADTPGGVYTANASAAPVKPGRKVQRDPSNN
jgi:hypothetical protein